MTLAKIKALEEWLSFSNLQLFGNFEGVILVVCPHAQLSAVQTIWFGIKIEILLRTNFDSEKRKKVFATKPLC